MVAIIPVKKLEQMDKAKQQFFKNMSKISDGFADEDPDKLDAIIEEATRAEKILEPSCG